MKVFRLKPGDKVVYDGYNKVAGMHTFTVRNDSREGYSKVKIVDSEANKVYYCDNSGITCNHRPVQESELKSIVNAVCCYG